MKAFYRRLSNRPDRALAVREAMIEVRGALPNPYFWPLLSCGLISTYRIRLTQNDKIFPIYSSSISQAKVILGCLEEPLGWGRNIIKKASLEQVLQRKYSEASLVNTKGPARGAEPSIQADIPFLITMGLDCYGGGHPGNPGCQWFCSGKHLMRY